MSSSSSSKSNANGDDTVDGVVGPTTNEEDQREAAALQERLRSGASSMPQSTTSSTSTTSTPPLSSCVYIDPGRHKYVLISACWDNNDGAEPSQSQRHRKRQYFVVSKHGASYHRDVAEPFVTDLQTLGYTNIDITGGGRIHYDPSTQQIEVYGYSYGFGLADHALSQSIIEQDSRFSNYDITWSNDGY